MIESFVNYMKAEKMSENTMRGYTNHINQMLKTINKPEQDITYLDLIDWKAGIANQASATVANKVAAVRSYFKFLTDVGVVETDPSKNLKRPSNIKNKEKPKEAILWILSIYIKFFLITTLECIRGMSQERNALV